MSVATKKLAEKPEKTRTSFLDKFLNFIEKSGNKLPDPATMFFGLAMLVIILSHLAAAAGWQAVNPATKEVVKAVSLLQRENIVRILTEMVNNFATFPPLGLVLVVMLGVGVAEYSGLISALLRRLLIGASTSVIVPAVVFTGILGNAAGDSALIVLPPLAAMIFLSVGRHPIAGIAAAYAGVAAGFSANLFINMLDVLLAGFTEKAAQIIDPKYIANPAMNYYFFIASTFLLTFVGSWVTVKIVEPRLGAFQGQNEKFHPLNDVEKKALGVAGLVALAYVGLIAYLTLPPHALLRDPQTGSLIISPFMKSLVPIMTGFFLFPAIGYGIAAGTIKSDKDLAVMMGKAMSTMGSYIVLAFLAAQFMAYFNWSNMGTILAIKGAELLRNIGFTGLPLLLGIIIFSSMINLLVASASAKWAVLGPVFVPMLMLLGYSPAFTQLAYRIGDSITNPITPLLAYFPIVLSHARKYDEKLGMGTLISTLLPFSIYFAVTWFILFSIWYFLDLPLGPGNMIRL
ncbi:AbgT family transporter [Thermosediminibacter litoriperuensis]|uniref:Aminobenzoyl-glutamate transport protein n=1 Tax=Thermosediminibacter litoriperuensis TaxID=291989 RepID=A0A5S5ANU4_9FIRM|nr:AbgT family transporter [Thermosediminibacter litoriperuensis]TYP53336.1 aminobenzoyl-glutamate transport protein [Thermosediminibacter litoriperuensis]